MGSHGLTESEHKVKPGWEKARVGAGGSPWAGRRWWAGLAGGRRGGVKDTQGERRCFTVD